MTLYLDTSSLVKLYVSEEGSDAVRQLVAEATIVATSVVAYPETRAALARLRREGALQPAALAAARRGFERQWPAFLAIEATDPLCHAAGELAERHGLRGFDSIHLASFAAVARLAGAEKTAFSSFDHRLNEAARKLSTRLSRPRR